MFGEFGEESEQDRWEKQYRLDHPVYNLNPTYPSFYSGIVLSFLGSIITGGIFQMDKVSVSRYALLWFAIGYAIDWFAKREHWKAFKKRFNK